VLDEECDGSVTVDIAVVKDWLDTASQPVAANTVADAAAATALDRFMTGRHDTGYTERIRYR